MSIFSVAKVRIALKMSHARQIVGLPSEILLDYPLWLDTSCFALACRVAQRKQINSAEAALIYQFTMMLHEFWESEYMFDWDPSINENYHIFKTPTSAFKIRSTQLLDAIAVTNESGMTVLGDLLQILLYKNLKNPDSYLIGALKWLIQTFEILLWKQVLNRSESELIRNKKLALDFVDVAQKYFNDVTIEQYLKKDATLFQLSKALSLAAKYSFCRKIIDHGKLMAKFEEILLQIEEISLDDILNLGLIHDGLDVIGVLHYFSLLLLRCLKTVENEGEDNQAANINARDLHKLILNTEVFDKLANSKKYQQSEIKFMAVGFYLKVKLHVLIHEHKSNPEQLTDQKFENFLSFLSQYISQSYQSFDIIEQVLELCSNESLQKSFLDEKDIIQTAFLTSFTGKSEIAFEPVFGRIEKALFKHYVKKDSVKKAAIVKILGRCKEELVSKIEQHYKNLSPLVTQPNVSRILNQQELLYGISYLIKVFLGGLRGKEIDNLKIKLEALDIRMLNCPIMVLYKHSKYEAIMRIFNLNTSKHPHLNENYRYLHKSFVKIQSEAASINLAQIEIANGDLLVSLINHFGHHQNFHSPYFFESFSIQSLELAHYLEFIMNHSTVTQDPYTLIDNLRVREIFAEFSEWTQIFNLTPAKFLTIGVRIFLNLCENYMDAELAKKKEDESWQQVYKRVSQSFFKTVFYIWGAILCGTALITYS